jgi:hypothetical protein
MDHNRSNPEAIGRNKPANTPNPRYHRTYKGEQSSKAHFTKTRLMTFQHVSRAEIRKQSVLSQRKTITPDRHVVNVAARCVLALFPWRDTLLGSVQANRAKNSTSLWLTSIQTLRWPTIWIGRGDRCLQYHQNVLTTILWAQLAQTSMTTVVSNGNDALNLLFEAAQSEERGDHTTRAEFPEEKPLAQFSTSPKAPTMSTTIHLLPTLSAKLLDIWNAYRFVRMRWLSSEEVVWLSDMCVDLLRPCSALLKLC